MTLTRPLLGPAPLCSGAGIVNRRDALVAVIFDVDGARVDGGEGVGQASAGLRARVDEDLRPGDDATELALRSLPHGGTS